MTSHSTAKYFLAAVLLAAPLSALADQLVPAGSVITCTVAEPKVSSQTEKIGDPILCELGHTELYGRTSFPFGSYLIGHFAEYKDPGHFVGKGWMELDFDKMVIQPDTVIPLNARVVATPGYKVDEGRPHPRQGPRGEGHGDVADPGAVAAGPDQPAAARTASGVEGRVEAEPEGAGRFRHPDAPGKRCAHASAGVSPHG